MNARAAVPPSALALVSGPWAAQTSWTVLDTGFGAANLFLEVWQCWRSNALRPALLHYVGVLSVDEAQQLPSLLTGEPGAVLARQCYDLEPGFHRLLLEDGHISLTLCVGEIGTMLSRQEMQADSVLAVTPAQGWDKWQIKALARCCKRGAQLLWGPQQPEPSLLLDAGFTASASAMNATHAVYAPRWQLRRGRSEAIHGKPSESRIAVVGAGMAGASVAHALALRGYPVDVYDAQAQPAGGASGLPVGLVVPHQSADDSPRSRMSRNGTRLMLQHASRLLQVGPDWNPGGVLELAIAQAGLADDEAEVLSQANAPQALCVATGWAQPMAYGEAQGLWHPHAAWIKPALLVQQWLQQPGIRFHGQAHVHGLERVDGLWLLRNAQERELGSAQQVVFANAHGCVDLLMRGAARMQAEATVQDVPWLADILDKLQALQKMHGTLSLGPMPAPTAEGQNPMPAFPVNGHGSFVGGIPAEQGPHWYAGATFQSDAQQHADLAREHAANFRKLQTLLPAVANTLQAAFASGQVQAWQGSRCITHDRLPLVGPLQEGPAPTLWLCAGMGARGLSFSALCAELLAAEMGGEPLPLENKLARSLGTRRVRRARVLSALRV